MGLQHGLEIITPEVNPFGVNPNESVIALVTDSCKQFCPKTEAYLRLSFYLYVASSVLNADKNCQNLSCTSRLVVVTNINMNWELFLRRDCLSSNFYMTSTLC